MSQSRQLAAIMFTDIVGYTALMGEDEQKAFKLLSTNRQLQQPIIEHFGGKWIKELGDGVMASFTTVSDAVNAAIKIQEACTTAKDFQLRIGIHLGEVVFENEDVFGDGVNIASRIQAIATPGGIYISESVQNNVSNKKEILTKFVKEERLKNVKDPVKIFEVIISSFAEPLPQTMSVQPKTSPGKSIAVLPFVNMSNDPEQEYFSDGMAEEILNSLSHVKDLKVAGRTSSFQFKGKNIDLREVGAKLVVATVLEGSVRKQGNRLRITAQLINVEDGFHLWSEKYDREMNDIFAIQDEIALAITEKLKITLLEKEKAIINKKPTENHEAYDLYLKGRFYSNKRGPGIIKSFEYFQKALEKDPALSLAYTGMADAYCILSLYCLMPPHDAMPKARKYAEKAIQLQSSESEAYTSLAFISTFYDWNWMEAKKWFQRVFASNPDYAPAHYYYSYYLSFVERNNEAAINEAKISAEILEPLVPISHHILSLMYIMAERFEEGLHASNMAIELDENSYPGYRSLGLSLAGMKKYAEATDALKKAVTLSSRQPLPLVELCRVYSFTGNIAEIQKIMDELILRSKTEYISASYLCCVAYFSNNVEKALEYLELAFDHRDSTIVCMNAYPLSSFIRTDKRFHPFLKRMKFPE